MGPRRGRRGRGVARGAHQTQQTGRGGGNTSTCNSGIDTLGLWLCTECGDVCNEDDQDDGEPSIECYVCKQYCHTSCACIDSSQLGVLSHSNLQFICNHCTNSKKEITSSADAKLDLILKMMSTLNSKVAELEGKLNDVSGEGLDQKIEEIVVRKLQEASETERRKKNLIFVNVKESPASSTDERKNDDLKEIKSLLCGLADLRADDVDFAARLGKVGGNRPRLLKVGFRSQQQRNEILKKAKDVNAKQGDKKKWVYINPDMSQQQRAEDKKLREEMKRRIEGGENNLKIRGGKIVTVDINTTVGKPGRAAQPRTQPRAKSELSIFLSPPQAKVPAPGVVGLSPANKDQNTPN